MNNSYTVFDESKQQAELYAALDLGSNSFHLVVARVVADAVQVVSKVKHKVRLAEGLDDNLILSEEVIKRGIATLESMKEAMHGVQPTSMRIVATHTLRLAKNAREFIRRAKAVFPYPIEIISGFEEARLIFVGVGSHSAFSGQRLIFDIGGGSTEFALGKGTEAEICKSLKMGCVSYQQRFFKDNVINMANTTKAITHAKLELELAAGNLSRFKWEQTVASSGTAKALSAVINSSKGVALDTPIEHRDLVDLLDKCIEAGHSDKINLAEVNEDRRPLFISGLCIYIAIVESLNITQVVYSDAALREGVLYELQPSHNSQSIRVRTAQSLAVRYAVDTNYAHKINQTCMYIFNKVNTAWQLDKPEYRHILGWAALLHEVGLQINSRSMHKHSSYIILNADLPGFNQSQQLLIAMLIRFHRKKIKVDELGLDETITQECFIRLLTILRVSLLLNINRHQPDLPEFDIQVFENTLQLGFEQKWFELSPMLVADIVNEDLYLKSVGINLELL